MRLNKINIQIWIDALRSGVYKQTKQCLQDGRGFCCLGVACDIFVSKKQLSREGKLIGLHPSAQNYSPEWIRSIDKDFKNKSGVALVSLNDDENFSFDEIADLLQAVYIEEVLENV